jgi:NAD(P)-dependent dehydrogenase (short-subunit alcohol dehydrogenase family)
MQLTAGRVAVITGAASGIGFAIAQRCAQAGMHVVLADVNFDQLGEAGNAIRAAGGSCETILTNVASPMELDELADRAFAAGSVQLVVSNAGIVRSGTAWEQPLEVWQQVLDVNLMASIRLQHAFLPRLIDDGQPAHILITGSMASVTARAGNGPYNVAKHGLLALAETLHHELTDIGAPIGVTLLMPGLVVSGMTGEFAKNVPGSITSEQASEVAMRAVAEGRLFAFTQPDRLHGVEGRFSSILTQQNPAKPGM